MPVNRNALIRYKTIDKCLQNRYRLWTLDDLIDACSDAIYEYEGIEKGVSKRTVQADIQIMRSDKLGYNAPIVVVDKRYYTYEESGYSITNIPISEQDLGRLNETVEFLKQFKGFSHFKELDGMVQKLEDHVYAQKTHQKPVIELEKNNDLKGLEHLGPLYQAIINKYAIRITYQSFKARQANSFDFHPYLLKEYRNRWFIIGHKNKEVILLNLALDRILDIGKSEAVFRHNPDFDGEAYFRHTIGVSVSPEIEPKEILLFVTRKHAPYVLTKPFHASQKLIEKDYYGITISLKVQHNFELEKEILGLGDGIKVISPERLKRNIIGRLKGGLDLYQTEINEKGLLNASRQLDNKGYSILKFVYTGREIKKINSLLNKFLVNEDGVPYAKRTLIKDFPLLKQYLINKNIIKIVNAIDPKAFLTKAIYFDKPSEANWHVSWHQDIPINVDKKTEISGFTSWTHKQDINSVCPPDEILKNIFTIRIHIDSTDKNNGALKILPGSHKKRLSDSEIKTITENSVPLLCEIPSGGIQLMKPLLLHSSSKSQNQMKRRVVHLEFASMNLPKGIDWLERDSYRTNH